ncbi:MAG: thermonuclease family protein [Desulfuromusa sp.]|jgi:micrococcal nuclease|nr:thermonuclease family protein [Desulfuromusa sp.]
MWKQICLLLSLLLLLASHSLATELTGKVLWIYDGDTLKVEKIGKVRLLGIDAPEYKASPRDNFYLKNFNIEANKLREIAQQGKSYLLRNVKGKRVRLELDHTQKDKYNRLLAYVYLPDGEMLNLNLLEKGLATVFRRYNFQYKKDFLKSEKKAQNQALGLWE